MSKKKIVSLLIAGVLTVGTVGGTLAWFTSSDSITNLFSTAGVINGDNDANAGIKIHEKFNAKSAENLTPGSNITKEVQVHSTVTYDQFVKVKLVKQFTDKNGADVSKQELDTNSIVLNLNKSVKTDKSEGSWYYNSEDGYYYYIGKVASAGFTNTLLDSVVFAKESNNQYKNIGFKVVVEAESIQASNEAYKDWASPSLQDRFAELEKKSAVNPIDVAL